MDDLKDWSDLHNELGDNEHDSVIDMLVDIRISDYVTYKCKADVILYRGIPCKAFVKEMTKQIFDYDNDGELIEELELHPRKFPHYIKNAAEKKLVEQY